MTFFTRQAMRFNFDFVRRCIAASPTRPIAPSLERNFIRGIAAGNRKNGVANISILDDGKRLKAAWTAHEANPSTFHSIWLRHNCRCPQCLNQSNQSCILSYELDPQVAIRHASVTDGERLDIRWSCGHEGYFDLDWLKKHCYSSQALEELRNGYSPTLLKPDSMPEISAKDLDYDQGVLKWLKILNDYGACLVTGISCTTEAGLEMCHKITPNLQETFYGGRTEIRVHEKPITASYGPDMLEPHMDIPMYESHPGINLLHCLSNDECVEGGESIVIDALAVAEKLRVTHPNHFATLVRVPATFHRIHYDRDHPVHMVYRTPMIHLNGDGQIVKLRWSPHNEGPLRVAEEDVEPYYEAYTVLAKALNSDSEFKCTLRLQPGDVLAVNDMRMLHGRTHIKLNGGVRFLNNFALNIDEFKSRLMVLCAKYDPDYQPKNILNHDFSYSTAARMN